MGPLGMPEMIVIFVIALLVFGPRKLPELGRSLGKSLGEFKRASNELRNTLEEEVRVEEQREATQRVAAAPAEPPVGPRPVDPPVVDSTYTEGPVVDSPAVDNAAEDSPADGITPRPAADTTPRGVTAD
jgi:TatA/E family protein of Tat protein translocase